MANKKSVKMHKCTVEGCKAEFCRPSKLKVHLRKHTGERPFECSDCNKTYTNDSHLRRHRKAVHLKLVENERISCPYEGCHQIYSNRYSYNSHLKNRHRLKGKLKYPCDQCDKSYFKKWQLVAHMYVHTGIPPYECDLCKIGFNNKILLYKHKSHHKIYTCECGETFHRWTALLKHRKNCKEWNKLYECDICQKLFKSKRILKVHRDLHDGIKKFKCTYENCDRAYVHKRNLNAHVNSYHLNIRREQFKCTYPGCEKLLCRQQTLKNHLKWHTTVKIVKPRRPRKDINSVKKSSVFKLIGIKVPYDIEKKVLSGESVNLEEIIPTNHIENESRLDTNSTEEPFSNVNIFCDSEKSKDIPIDEFRLTKKVSSRNLMIKLEKFRLNHSLDKSIS